MSDSRLLEVEPNRRFVFEWSPAGHPTRVSITLEKRGEGTVVNLTESGYYLTEDYLVVCLDCATEGRETLTLLMFYLEIGSMYGKVTGPQLSTRDVPC